MLITSNSSPASGELLEDGALDAEMEFSNHIVPESSHTIEIQYVTHVPEFNIYDSDTTIIEETIIDEGFSSHCEYSSDNITQSYDYTNGIPSDDISDLNESTYNDGNNYSSNDCSLDSHSLDGNSSETDLTNLNWLQNITNIMPVPTLSISPKPPPKPLIKNMRLHKFKKTILKCQEDFVQNNEEYKKDRAKKPPYSYCSLICLAMRHNGNKMTLAAIYSWIKENFEYYKYADPTWQNSIRHNLSLNKVFVKIARLKHEPGKGGFWKLDLARLEESKKCKGDVSSPKPPKKQKQPNVQKQLKAKNGADDKIEGNNYDEMFEITKRATDSIADMSNQLPDFSLDGLDFVLSNSMGNNSFGPNVIVESVPAEEELGDLLLAAPWEDLQPDLTDSLFDSYLK